MESRQAAQRARVSSYMPTKPEIPGDYGFDRAPPPLETFVAMAAEPGPPNPFDAWWAVMALAGLMFVSLTLSY
jgi:hypothetical protein